MANPDDREVELDIYDPRNCDQPPYLPEYVARYRAAQLARMRRITSWAKAKLQELKERDTGELERPFIVHRTLANPRFPRCRAGPQRPLAEVLLHGQPGDGEQRARGTGALHHPALMAVAHYYAGQPELLKEATVLIRGWLVQRELLES